MRSAGDRRPVTAVDRLDAGAATIDRVIGEPLVVAAASSVTFDRRLADPVGVLADVSVSANILA